MESIFRPKWWVFLLHGIIVLLFGLMALTQPGMTLGVLILTFGIFAIADGIVETVLGIVSYKSNDLWWSVLLSGIASILIGILTLANPHITGLVLLYLIGLRAFVLGFLEVVAAIELRHLMEGEWMLIVGGILSIIFGVMLFIYPAEGALSLLWLIGIFAVVGGVWLILFSFHMRSMTKKIDRFLEGES